MPRGEGDPAISIPEKTFRASVETTKPRQEQEKTVHLLRLGEKTFEAKKLAIELRRFLQEHSLSESEQKMFVDWWVDSVDRARAQEQYRLDNENDDSPVDNFSIYRYTLGRLEEFVTQYIKEKHERLNPFLLSREGARKEIETSLERIKTTEPGKQKVLVVVAMDLDGFKGANDEYGHIAGDELLKSFGRALNAAIRPGEGANGIHFSGDEFGISLEMSFPSNLNEMQIQDLIQKRLEAIIKQASDKTKRPDNQKQEASAGFVIVKPEDNLTYDEIREMADKTAEISKLLAELPGIRARRQGTEELPIRCEDRVVMYEKNDDALANFTEAEVREARIRRGLNRPINNEFGRTTEQQTRDEATSALIDLLSLAETNPAEAARLIDSFKMQIQQAQSTEKNTP
jgi:diguanylate cyclase (GGDEF)-like protein